MVGRIVENKKIKNLKKTNAKSKLANLSQPFYGDLLARSLLRIGVPKFEAYEIAHEIWKKISHRKNAPLKISKLVVDFLKERHSTLIPRYRAWQKIMKSPKPLILIIGGGTGIGTSTLAVRLAWLLNISHVVGTDSVREIVRRLLPQSVIPSLSVSTFEEANTSSVIRSKRDRLIAGFLSQSRKVLFGIEALIDRAMREKKSTVIEGIHLIPGEMDFLDRYSKQAMIIPIMLDIRSQSSHRARFLSRNLQNSKRPKDRYLKYFKEIRLIRDYLVEASKKRHVPVVENYDLRDAERALLDAIFRAYHSRKKSPGSRPAKSPKKS